MLHKSFEMISVLTLLDTFVVPLLLVMKRVTDVNVRKVDALMFLFGCFGIKASLGQKKYLNYYLSITIQVSVLGIRFDRVVVNDELMNVVQCSVFHV
jgi:hypothetical protein